ncbi:hypothetical protein BDP27DRAFT_1425897 [Rhodocollybia butyracea]|uniref:Uncharacterized protein n=1 Tax=Rhodocollybia butyracea TaxID=206335 RepID=A0A9P5PIC7_9AGAR|nr:hypothetical protein BDP27DRAFT_1425897 [Rhodocollybia butyracea]
MSDSESDSEYSLSELSDLTDSDFEPGPKLITPNPLALLENPVQGGKTLRKKTDFDNLANLQEYLRRIAHIFNTYFVLTLRGSLDQYVGAEWKEAGSALRALRDLKDVPASLKPFITESVKQTSLSTILVKIMNTRAFEHHPLLAERFATHRWGPQVARELLKYTPEHSLVDPVLPLKTEKIGHEKLLKLIHQYVPFVGRPETTFLFSYLGNFMRVWDEILLPSLRATGIEPECNLEHSFGFLVDMCRAEKIPDYVKTNFILHSVMEHNLKFKALMKEANQAITSVGVTECHICKDKPLDSESRCEHTIKVDSHETATVDKKVLYCFHDRSSLLYAYRKRNKKRVKSIHISKLPAPGIQHHIRPRTNLDDIRKTVLE